MLMSKNAIFLITNHIH